MTDDSRDCNIYWLLIQWKRYKKFCLIDTSNMYSTWNLPIKMNLSWNELTDWSTDWLNDFSVDSQVTSSIYDNNFQLRKKQTTVNNNNNNRRKKKKKKR